MTGYGADQQPGITGRPQAHVHLIELAGRGLGTENVDNALAETRIENRIVDGFITIGGFLGVCIVNEHQVQVRGIAQLQSTQLAITDDSEIRVTGRTIRTSRITMTADQVGEGYIDHMVQHHLGNPGQVIAHFHQRQGSVQLGRRYPKDMRLLEVPQGLHLLFQVLKGNPQHLLAQVVFQLRLGRGMVEAFCVQQLVQQ